MLTASRSALENWDLQTAEFLADRLVSIAKARKRKGAICHVMQTL